MQNKKVVILGVGGTIAGIASNPSGHPKSNVEYTAGEVGVPDLVGTIAVLRLSDLIETEQVAQIDSKDMSFAVWTVLAARVQHHLARLDVGGVVITHGTDTLEETAYFLQSVLNPAKPVVLTCAMRPASALVPDGPQNVLDAVTVASHEGAHGVVVVCAGTIHSALDVQKIHTYQLQAFGSDDAGAIGFIEENSLKTMKNLPVNQQIRAQAATENIALLNRMDT